jgi:hypothetical protein
MPASWEGGWGGGGSASSGSRRWAEVWRRPRRRCVGIRSSAYAFQPLAHAHHQASAKPAPSQRQAATCPITRSPAPPPTWNAPSLTILKLTTAAPSSARQWLAGGIEPGLMPPMSAWWPRLGGTAGRREGVGAGFISHLGGVYGAVQCSFSGEWVEGGVAKRGRPAQCDPRGD